MESHLLECKEVELSHKQENGEQAKRILHPVSCVFAGGESTLITGDTGAGKSSFLHILSALQRPTAGVVNADGIPISRLLAPHRDNWRKQAGLVFQHALLFEDLTVLENVMLPLVNRGGSISTLRERAMAILQLLTMDHASAQTARLLSGGESQRVAIARALVAEPSFLFMDEPTAHQDRSGVDIVLNCLESVCGRKGVVVVVSHDPRLVREELFDQFFHLQNGCLGNWK